MVKAMPISRLAGRFLLFVLHAAQLILTIGGIGILFTRSSFMSISADIFGAEAPLMNSAWLDMVFRPYSAVLVVLLAGFVLFLRERAGTSPRKLAVDLVHAVILAGWLSILLSALYAPVL